MIFTKKGFLGTKVIEQLYVLSHLTSQTFNTRELRILDIRIKTIRDNISKGDELFVKAKKLKLLNTKKKLVESKYKKLRAECLKRTKALEQTLTWKTFIFFYSVANYIFLGYTYPKPLRSIISFHKLMKGNIYSDTSLVIDNSWPISDSVLFESKKLCSEFLNGKIIDIKFLIEHTKFKVDDLNEIDTSDKYPGINTSDKYPGSADEYIERPIDLNKYCIKNSSATFLVRASGDSMQGSGITNHSILVVDRSIKSEHDSIVLATIDGEFLCRRLKLKPKICLMPDNPNRSPNNPNCAPIFINPAQELEIIGVVTTIITKL
jgi:DNA polymerase V